VLDAYLRELTAHRWIASGARGVRSWLEVQRALNGIQRQPTSVGVGNRAAWPEHGP